MPLTTTDHGAPAAAAPEVFYREHERSIHEQTDRLFAGLMIVQWLAAIAAAVWISPRAWSGPLSRTHLHVWAAVYLGGALTLFPVALAMTRPGRASTRYIIATAQMLMSSLLIHFTGGRIETHFHVFGSLAFLSFYRDWRVLVPATVVVAADHFLRGAFWPQSVFGVLTPSNWRWLEHAGWVVFEDVFLIGACVRGKKEMWDIAERTAALRASDVRYRAIVDRAEGIFLADARTKRLIECNAAFHNLLGYTAEEAAALTVYDVDAEPRDGVDAMTERFLAQRAPMEVDRSYRHKTGSVIRVTVSLSRLAHGGSDILCAAVRDVTEHKRAEQALLDSEARYALAARGANDGLWDWNVLTGEMYFSPRWKAMLGLTETETTTQLRDWFGRVHPDDLQALEALLDTHLRGDSAHFEHEFRIGHSDGSFLWVLCRGLAVRDHTGRVCRMAGSQTDITDRQVVQEQLRHAALHDSLTALPNRALFMELLERAIVRAVRHTDYLFAVLFLDVDRFKLVNDSLGHIVGDQLLIELSTRSETACGPATPWPGWAATSSASCSTISRSANEASHRRRAHPGRPARAARPRRPRGVHHRQHRHRRPRSRAIAAPKSILRDADTAMYHAKARASRGTRCSTPRCTRGRATLLHSRTTSAARVERREFRVHYQPIVRVEDRRIAGFEALVRWQHPERATGGAVGVHPHGRRDRPHRAARHRRAQGSLHARPRPGSGSFRRRLRSGSRSTCRVSSWTIRICSRSSNRCCGSPASRPAP